ncbi:MAG: hypothetical protein KDC95_17935 [Planctomycetes bacterium]|nr:hypothetical protein [Planctomycetota bacterium]
MPTICRPSRGHDELGSPSRRAQPFLTPHLFGLFRCICLLRACLRACLFRARVFRACPLLCIPLFLGACAGTRPAAERTPEMAARSSLFDVLLAKTVARDPGAQDRRAEFEQLRTRFETAASDEELWLAIRAFHARRGRGGLDPVRAASVTDAESAGGHPTASPDALPLEFGVDHNADASPRFFVRDLPFDPEYFLEGSRPAIGDVVVAIHGLGIDEWVRRARELVVDSTEAATRARLAAELRVRHTDWPRELAPQQPTLRLRRSDGREFDVVLGWTRSPIDLWQRVDDPYYDGFSRVLTTQAFDLFDYAGSAKVLVLSCRSFATPLEADLTTLMEHATTNDLLEHDLILDFSRCAGGNDAPRLLAHLFNSPILPLVTQAAPTLGARPVEASARVAAPAPRTRFRGHAVCLFGPCGDASVDRVASIVLDQHLAIGIGRPTNGRGTAAIDSELLISPTTGNELGTFHWANGETLRGDGSLLEGNPPAMAVELAPNRENARQYYRLLIDEAMRALGHR